MKSFILSSVALVVLVATILLSTTTYSVEAVPVDVYAGDFLNFVGKPLAGFDVLHEETRKVYTTDAKGALHLDFPVGSNVTMTLFKQKGYAECQTGTVTVPAAGMVGEGNELVLQVPDDFAFDMLNMVMPHKRNWSECQVVVTVCNYKKTCWDCPQGWPGVVATLHPNINEYTYYFGTWGKFSNKTNPLPNKLKASSWDGGVMLMNIPMDKYRTFTVTAELPGSNVTFSQTNIKCIKPGRLINAAPNQGPRAQFPLPGNPGGPKKGELRDCGWHW